MQQTMTIKSARRVNICIEFSVVAGCDEGLAKAPPYSARAGYRRIPFESAIGGAMRARRHGNSNAMEPVVADSSDYVLPERCTLWARPRRGPNLSGLQRNAAAGRPSPLRSR